MKIVEKIVLKKCIFKLRVHCHSGFSSGHMNLSPTILKSEERARSLLTWSDLDNANGLSETSDQEKEVKSTPRSLNGLLQTSARC